MKKYVRVSCVSAITLCAALVMFTARADDRSTIVEIEQRVEELRLLMLNPDKPRLEALFADQLTYGHSDGRVQSKREIIDGLIDRKSIFHSISLSNQSVVVSGDAAVVRHRFDADVMSNGRAMRPSIGVLQVWQKQSGAWRFFVRQAY